MKRDCNNNPTLGKYGRIRKTYLQEIGEQAQSTVNAIIARMAEIDGVTEELKATDPMRWVGLMNNCRHCAEELVIREIVY